MNLDINSLLNTLNSNGKSKKTLKMSLFFPHDFSRYLTLMKVQAVFRPHHRPFFAAVGSTVVVYSMSVLSKFPPPNW